MRNLIATRHAQARKQRRGISQMQVRLLHFFGEDHLQKGGSSLTYVPEETIRQLRAALDGLNHIAMVKSPEETVLTVMHRTRKVATTQYVA